MEGFPAADKSGKLGFAAGKEFVQEKEALEILAWKSCFRGKPVADIAELALGMTNGDVAEFRANGYFVDPAAGGLWIESMVLPSAFVESGEIFFPNEQVIISRPCPEGDRFLDQSNTLVSG